MQPAGLSIVSGAQAGVLVYGDADGELVWDEAKLMSAI